VSSVLHEIPDSSLEVLTSYVSSSLCPSLRLLFGDSSNNFVGFNVLFPARLYLCRFGVVALPSEKSLK